MSVCELDKLLAQYEENDRRIKKTLQKKYGLAIQWRKDNDSFYILSKSAKKEGYQLTYFYKQTPQSDIFRVDYMDKDFIHELNINNCVEGWTRWLKLPHKLLVV